MAKKMTLLTAFLFALLAMICLYPVIHVSGMTIGCLHVPLYGCALLYVGSGTLTAYLVRAGRKL